jgi:MoxR-like ATPase
MPIITKSMLDKALNPTQNANETSFKVSYQNQGPSRLDTWLRFMEDNPNCWQKREAFSVTSAKKKIILCNTLLRESAPDTWDLALISALIEHYEVYLWPGSDKELLTEPLSSSEEFWEKLPLVPPASQQVVAEGLAAQGFATEGYHIIDHLAYNSLLHRCKTQDNPNYNYNQNDDILNHIELNGAPLEHVIAAIDTTRIKNVITSLPTTKELEAFLQFPNLEKITFVGFWSDSYLEQLAGHDIHLQIQNVNSSKLTVPTSFKKVSLRSCQITFNPANNEDNLVESLELRSCTILDGNLDLGIFPKLKELLLSGLKAPIINLPSGLEVLEIDGDIPQDGSFPRLKNLKMKGELLPPANDLEVLEIDSDIAFPKNASFPRLKELKIVGDLLSPIDCSLFPNLETISIAGYPPLQNLTSCVKLKHFNFDLKEPINFAQFTDLEELEITTSQLPFGIKNIPKLERLTVVILASKKCNSDVVSIEGCPNLKHLTLGFPYGKHNKINLLSLPKLEYLTIVHSGDFLLSDVENCPQLRFLNLQSLPRDIDLSQYQHLEYLHVSNCRISSSSVFKSASLKSLELSEFDLRDFDFSQLPNLEELDISKFSGHEINLGNCLKLKTLKLHSNYDLEILDISKITNLEELTIHDCCSLNNLNLTHTKLKYLSLTNSGVAQIDLSGCPDLEALEISDCNDLTMLSLQNCRKLKRLTISGSLALLKEIPFTQLPELESISITIEEPQADSENFNPDLSRLSKLKTISVSSSLNLQVDLNLRNATELREVSIDVEDCKVNLENCTKLQTASLKANQIEVNHLEDCKQLRLFKASTPEVETIAWLKDQLPRDCLFQLISSTPLQQMHLQSESSPVSIFSLIEEEMGFCSNTGQLPAYNASGGLKVTITSASKLIEICHNNYRTFIFDEVRLSKGRILFTSQKDDCKPIVQTLPTFTDQTIAKFHSQVHAKPDQAVAIFEGLLEPDKYYPLATLQAMANPEIEVYCRPENAVQLYWHSTHQQYHVKLRAPSAQSVEILYRFKTSPSYELKPQGPPIKIDSWSLLPYELAYRLIDALYDHQDLKFLFDESLSLEQKTESLIQYCHFKQGEQEWASAQDQGDIENLLTSIKKREGVCSHNSKAFVLLARCLGIPARMIMNEIHAFVEIPYETKHGWRWRRVGLGGGRLIDLTPKEKRENKFQLLPKLAASEKVDKPVTQRRPLQDVYYREFMALAEKQELSSAESLLKTVLPPAVELKANQDPLKVSEYLHQALNLPVDTPYLYVNNPKEFALEARCLVNGQRQKIATPLANILQTGGVVVVNWDHFNPTDIATYKSILEPEPTLSGKSVSKAVRVIGLTKEHTENCTAFSSRCQHYKLPDNFITKEHPRPITETDTPIQTDLFHSLNWREQLLGKITFKGDQLLLEQGVVIDAIQKKQPVIIYNPPEDERLKVLLYRINVERKLFFNGKLLSIPEGVTVQTATRENAKSLDNVIIEQETDIREHHNHIFLGLHNFHECFEQLTFTESKQAEIKPGFLAWPEPIFYVTESLPLSDWQALLAHIKENYPQKTFKFILAPGVSIQQVAQNPAPASCLTLGPNTPLSDMPAIITSNDRNYLCKQLAKQAKENGKGRVKVIYLKPEPSFSQMVAEMKIIERPDSNKVDFSYQEKDILEALKFGQIVILNGELPPGLYQALLPLFSANHVFCNGERINIKGRLMAVLPETSAQKLPLIHYGVSNYTFEDYKASFPSYEAKKLEAIEQFYQYAQELPHRGSGYPDKPLLSHERLANMLRVLNNIKPLHRANPIKGLFHYDYLKDSKGYAYLNVMAKLCFMKEPQHIPYRAHKLRRLIDQHKINSEADCKEYTWQILNCLSGENLIKLFSHGIEPRAAFPSLTSSGLTELWKMVQALREIPLQEEKVKSHVEKQNRQLQTLLRDNNTRVVNLKGSSGVGKTHAIKGGNNSYEDIQKWLYAQHGNLLLDEANKALPGTWDFLTGLDLEETDRTVYFDNRTYPVKKHQKIVATSNPENYPGRCYHSFLQNAETIYYKMPDEGYLKNAIVEPDLKKKGLQEYAAAIITAYQLIQSYNPTSVYSTRALLNLMQRFIALTDKYPDQARDSLVWRAGLGEFAGSIQSPDQRQRFCTELASKLNVTIPLDDPAGKFITISPQCAIPQEKAYLVEGIEQDLLLRDMAIAHDTLEIQMAREFRIKVTRLYHKQLLLIEGPSGIGKSFLFKHLLEKHGFSKDSENPQKKYYEITLDNQGETRKILEQAFQEGAVVVLDELNLDESIETFLEELLTGKHQEKKYIPGFMVFSSQNPGYFEGRKSIPKSLQDRAHRYYFDSYSRGALIDIARRANIVDPESFVAAYEEAQINHKVNMRTFYTLLSAYNETPSVDKDNSLSSVAGGIGTEIGGVAFGAGSGKTVSNLLDKFSCLSSPDRQVANLGEGLESNVNTQKKPCGI